VCAVVVVHEIWHVIVECNFWIGNQDMDMLKVAW
jgi:hypothetical protein